MEYTHLGRSGLNVSRLCLGTMNFGPQTTKPTRTRSWTPHTTTASTTSTPPTSTASTAEGVRPRRSSATGSPAAGGRRERTVLATKLYGAMGDWPNDGKLSALNIRRALDASLTRLKTDYIDIYQFHHVDRETPWDEIWQAMEVAVAQGKILYAGSSNFAGWHIATAQEAARRRNYTGLVSEQSIYNLLTRDVELEVLPAAQANGVGVIAWSPAPRRTARRGPAQGTRRQAPARGPAGRDARRRTARRSRRTRSSPTTWATQPGDIALAWLLHQPAVTAPIIGPRTRDQLDAAVRAVDLTLDEAALDRLDEIFPGSQDRAGALRLVGGESQERRRRRVVPRRVPLQQRGRAAGAGARGRGPPAHPHQTQMFMGLSGPDAQTKATSEFGHIRGANICVRSALTAQAVTTRPPPRPRHTPVTRTGQTCGHDGSRDHRTRCGAEPQR